MKTSNVMMILMIFLLGIMTVHTVNAVLTDNLLFGYEANEPSGTDAYDVLGMNNGTYTGAYTLNNAGLASNLDTSVNFTGMTTYIEMPMDILQPINSSQSYTFNTWMKVESDIPSYYEYELLYKQFYLDAGLSISFYRRSESDDNVVPRICHGDGVTSNCVNVDTGTCVLTQSQFNAYNGMTTITWNGTDVSVYYDSVLCGSKAQATVYSSDVSITARIGRGDAQTFYGQLDSIMMWSRELSPSEITTLYNSGTGLPYPFTPIVCVEDWISNNTVCNGFNYTIQYYDSNNCGTYDDLPVNNGSVINCEPTSITGAVTKVNNSIVSILVALIILAVIIGIIGLLLNHLGMMSKNVMMIMGAVLVALVLIILVLSFKMIGVV